MVRFGEHDSPGLVSDGGLSAAPVSSSAAQSGDGGVRAHAPDGELLSNRASNSFRESVSPTKKREGWGKKNT